MIEQSRWGCGAFGTDCLLKGETQCDGECFFGKSLNLFKIGIALYRKAPCEPLFVNDAGKKTAGIWMQEMLDEIGRKLDGRFKNQEELPLAGSAAIREKVFGYTAYPLLTDFLMVLFRDVTKIEKIRVIEQNRMIYEKYNRIISEIIHEVGNPLAGIMGILQVTLLNLDSYTRDDIERNIDSALIEVKQLSKILKLLRPLGADSQAEWKRINIKQSLKQVLEQEISKSTGISYRIHSVSENWDATLREADFTKVIEEVVSNAVSAMPDGGEIVIRQDQETMYFQEIVIRNSGPEISDDMLERIFYPFFSTFEGKMGMGLTIARKRMLNMGGMLFAKPCASGACFVILVPAKGSDYEVLGLIG